SRDEVCREGQRRILRQDVGRKGDGPRHGSAGQQTRQEAPTRPMRAVIVSWYCVDAAVVAFIAQLVSSTSRGDQRRDTELITSERSTGNEDQPTREGITPTAGEPTSKRAPGGRRPLGAVTTPPRRPPLGMRQRRLPRLPLSGTCVDQRWIWVQVVSAQTSFSRNFHMLGLTILRTIGARPYAGRRWRSSADAWRVPEGRRAQTSIASSSSAVGRKGLSTKASAPAANARSRSSGSALALTTMIAVSRVSRCSRIRRHASRPLPWLSSASSTTSAGRLICA